MTPAPSYVCERPQGEPTGEQKLVAAVIRQAVLDVGASDLSPARRDMARAFLDNSPALHWWCTLAGLDPRVVSALATRVLQEGRLVPTRGRPRVVHVAPAAAEDTPDHPPCRASGRISL